MSTNLYPLQNGSASYGLRPSPLPLSSSDHGSLTSNLQLIMIRILSGRLDGLGSFTRLLRRRLGRLAYHAIAFLVGIAHIHIPIVRASLVLSFISISLVLAVLLDEVGQILDGAGARVGDGRILAAGGEELDGWEAGDLVGNIVGGGVDFGNCDFGGEGGGAGIEGGEFFIFGGQPGTFVSLT